MNLLLIDKYLIWSFFKKIFSVLFVFIIIFLIVDLIEDVDRMLDYNLTFNQFSFIYYYSIPHYMNIAFPMAILIATVMTFTLMQKNNEITNFNFSKSDFPLSNIKTNTTTYKKTQEISTQNIFKCVYKIY